MRNLAAYADAIYNYAYAARLCPDVLLRAFGAAYPVHRVILASQNAYFATLLRWVSWQPSASQRSDDEPQWSGLPSHNLVLGEDVTQRGFEWILEYFYASPHLAISSDNAFDVLAAAHYLGVDAVQTACVEFLSQHLDPNNFAACLIWATKVDHGDASDMLAASCRRLLALHLPRNLTVWAPALPYIEPRTLLDILSSDYLAVPTEYDRYELVKEVARLLVSSTEPTAAEAPGRPDGVAPGGGEDDGGIGTATVAEPEFLSSGDVPSGREVAGGAAGGIYDGLPPYRRPAVGAMEVQHMLSSALNISDQQGLARHLRLTRSRSVRSWPQPPWDSPTAGAAAAANSAGQRASWCLGGGGEGGGCSDAAAARMLVEGGDSGDSGVPGGSCAGPFSPVGSSARAVPSDCHVDCSTTPESVSQASSRSTVRLSDHNRAPEDAILAELGGGSNGGCGCDRTPGEGRGTGSDGCEGATRAGQQAAASVTEGARGTAGAVVEPAVGGEVAPMAAEARAAAGAGCGAAEDDPAELARLLLHEAVRYEHLTVPQLMAIQLEGLVAPPVLHTALWDRTRMDYQLHIRTTSPAAPAAGNGHGRRQAATRAIGRLSAPLSYGDEGTAPGGGGSGCRQEGREAAVWAGRPFRICWRLSCRALKKLRPGDMLQSEPHQYAGAVWLVRLCCGDGAPGHLGLYVGRQVAASTAASGVGQRTPGNPAPWLAAHNRQHPPQRHNRQPPALPPPRASPSPPAAAVASAASFISYVDLRPSLRGRCRVSMCQPDNTALQGRLCLGDSDDFTVDFAAGGYYGRARLVPQEDVLGLRDEAEVLAFVSLQALLDDADSGE